MENDVEPVVGVGATWYAQLNAFGRHDGVFHAIDQQMCFRRKEYGGISRVIAFGKSETYHRFSFEKLYLSDVGGLLKVSVAIRKDLHHGRMIPYGGTLTCNGWRDMA